MYVKCSEQVTHCRVSAFVTIITCLCILPGLRSTAYGPAHSTFHNTARILDGSTGHFHHMDFQLLHAHVKELGLPKISLFQVLLSTEMKINTYFWCQWYWKKKRDGCTFGSRSKQRKISGLLFALLEQNALNCLPMTTLLEVNIPFYPLSTERNHSSMCWDLFLLYHWTIVH